MASFVAKQQISVLGQRLSVPVFGFGTATLLGDVCVNAVTAALKNGYRMIDTALLYGNHHEVGEALRGSGVPREEVWLTSKVAFFPEHDSTLWMYDANNVKGEELASIDLSLKQLGVEYVDLMLIHNPTASAAEYNAACLPHFFELGVEGAYVPSHFPDGESIRPALLKHKLEIVQAHHNLGAAKAAAYDLRRRSWRAMEAALRAGKCRSIGVSNYPAALLLEMKQYAEIMPSFNQLEMHPRFASPELLHVCKQLGVQLIAYGVGNAARFEKDSALTQIAQRSGYSTIQVVTQWLRQKGIIPLVRSASAEHIAENIALQCDFKLTADDMDSIDALNRDYPYYWDPEATRLTLRK